MAQSTTNAQFTAPAAAAGAAITPNATAWANSAYADLLASVSAAAVLTGIVVYPTTNVTAEFELDVATGAAGSEVVIATIKGKFLGNVAWETAYVPVPVPIDHIANGTRLAARLRKSGTDVNVWRVAITYLKKPIAGTLLTTAQPVKVTAAGGPMTVLNTNSANWVNTTWKELITSTATAIVLTHYVAPPFAGNMEAEFDIGVGAAGSESVITTVRIRAQSNDGGPWIVPFVNPLDAIPTATRVAARWRGTNTFSSGPFGLCYVEKPL